PDREAPCGSRPLHSSPTRRSSDLAPGRTNRGPDARRATWSGVRRAGRGCPAGRTADAGDPVGEATYDRWSAPTVWARHPKDPRRSEEHTSELQSRENLVCRLLLEK